MASTIVDRTGSSSSSAEVDRLTGLASSASVKGPCRTLSLTAITLSGEQTVAGVAVVAGDRVLVGGQADDTANGIYLVSTGAWSRAPDWNRADDVMDGTLILVTGGSNSGLWECVASTQFVDVGTDAVAFAATLEVAMGDSIHTATTVTSIDDTDEIGFWDSTLGALVKITVANFRAAFVHAATTATTIDDTDEIGFWDSVTPGFVKITFANFRTKLATLFLPLTGGTMTGSLQLGTGSGGTYNGKLILTPNDHYPTFIWYSGATPKTQIICDVNTSAMIFDAPGQFQIRDTLNGGGVAWLYLDASSAVINKPFTVTAGQIVFPASQNASSDANTLDDYEEGTWTPAFSATGATFSYSSQTGRYVKIGKTVWFMAKIVLNTSGNTLTANPLSLTGLPFAFANVANQVQVYIAAFFGATSSYIQMSFSANPGQTTMACQGITAAGTSNLTAQNSNQALHATNGSTIYVTGCYTID